jgi:hypothetical protein
MSDVEAMHEWRNMFIYTWAVKMQLYEWLDRRTV